MKSKELHVVTAYFNPMRWKSRYTLMSHFIKHMLDSGVSLTVVECAFGQRPFEITAEGRDINLVRVRANSVIWLKESLLNIGLSRLPHDAQYICLADGDIKFRDPQWARKAVDALQQYPIIQPWAHCYDLGPNGEHAAVHHSFCKQHWRVDHSGLTGGKDGVTFGHPGFVWVIRRDTVDRLGGLIETAIAGSGDTYMAHALVGKASSSVPSNVSAGYLRPIAEWERRALLVVQKNIGYLPHTIEHFWHGPKPKRRYVHRMDIIVNHQYDPAVDLRRNIMGVLELAGNKPDLAHDLVLYFLLRDEDSNEWDPLLS